MICNLISSSVSAFYLLIGTELTTIHALAQALVCFFWLERKQPSFRYPIGALLA